MIRTVAVFVFVSFACVATAFSQTIDCLLYTSDAADE